MTMLSGKRNEVIDVLRGFAAICMILGHSILRYPIDLTCVSWCSGLEHWIFTFHMELFFLVAGICYRCFDYKKFIEKKFCRIMIPYLFFGVLSLFLHAFGGSAVNRSEPIGIGVYKLFFLGGNYWFLYVIFLIFLIYPLVEKVFNTDYKKLLLMACLLAIPYFIEISELFKLNLVVYHLPFFIVGQIGARIFVNEFDFKSRLKRNTILGYCLLVICIIVYLVLDRILNSYTLYNLFRFLRSMSIIVALFICVYVLNNGLDNKKIFILLKRIICKCGQFSLPLYLFNGYILTVARIILCNLLKIDIPLVLVTSIWIINIATTLLLCDYIIPKVKMLKTLCGL